MSGSFNSRQLETERAGRPVVGEKWRGGPLGSARCRRGWVLAAWAEAGQFIFREGRVSWQAGSVCSGGCQGRPGWEVVLVQRTAAPFRRTGGVVQHGAKNVAKDGAGVGEIFRGEIAML